MRRIPLVVGVTRQYVHAIVAIFKYVWELNSKKKFLHQFHAGLGGTLYYSSQRLTAADRTCSPFEVLVSVRENSLGYEHQLRSRSDI